MTIIRVMANILHKDILCMVSITVYFSYKFRFCNRELRFVGYLINDILHVDRKETPMDLI